MSRAGLIRLVTLLLALGLGSGARAAIVEEQVTLPVTVRHGSQAETRRDLTVTVFRDDARPRAPFLVLGHGRPVSAAQRAALGRSRYAETSHYLVSLGFTVFVPTRIGYGVTGGPDLERSGPCDTRRYEPAFDAAAQQLRQVIVYARGRPDIEAGRGLIVGQSFGGATAIALAAAAPPGLRGAVNFAGGSGGRPATHPAEPCSPAALSNLFAGYGRAARLPTLWFYAENDRFFGPQLPRAWFSAFTAAGGNGRFVLLPAHGADGHGSIATNPAAWRPVFELFLDELGFQLPR